MQEEEKGRNHMIKLQLALDVADNRKVLEIAEQIGDVIDIIEVGTPVIIKNGLQPVKNLKEKYPDLVVLADSKIMDGAEIEAEDICKSGADLLTVLALADDFTVEETVKIAHAYGRRVMADLICVKNLEKRAKELLDMGVDYIGIHTGVDMQKRGRTPLKDLQSLAGVIETDKLAVAGGINMKTAHSYAKEHPGIMIVGSALYRAADIRTAVLEMKGILKNADERTIVSDNR